MIAYAINERMDTSELRKSTSKWERIKCVQTANNPPKMKLEVIKYSHCLSR